MQRDLTRWLSRLALITTLAVLTTGCLAYRGGKVAKLESGPKAPQPVVEKVKLDLRVTQNGKPLPSGAIGKMITEVYTEITMKNLTDSGVFSDVQMIVPNTACWSNEYVLKYEVDNWGNQGAAVASGIICGLTLCVIPGFATDHYTLRAEVLDYQGRSRWKQKYDDQMTTVIWLGFLPCVLVPPWYPTSVARATLDNLYQHSFQDMVTAKAFTVPPPATAGAPSSPSATSQANSPAP